MFGLGGMEVLIILVVGVVVLGPERLPKVMRSFTKLMSEFRRVSTDLQRTINTEINIQEHNERQKREKLAAKKTDGSKSGTKKKKPASAKPDNGADRPKNNKKSVPAEAVKVEAPQPVLENTEALPEQQSLYAFESKVNEPEKSPEIPSVKSNDNGSQA